MFSKFVIPVTLILLVTMGMLQDYPDNSAAVPYHAEILDRVDRIAWEFNGWSGRLKPLPPAAINLLDPNAILAREYYHKDRNIFATLLIVQCKKIRDMAGHYPPVCYPAHGWSKDETSSPIRSVGGFEMKPYQFVRQMGDTEHTITVYNVFALPTGETSVSMNYVRQIGSNYQYKAYGAAQIQVVLDESVASEDHQWVLEQMVSIVRPTVQAVIESGTQQTESNANEE